MRDYIAIAALVWIMFSAAGAWAIIANALARRKAGSKPGEPWESDNG